MEDVARSCSKENDEAEKVRELVAKSKTLSKNFFLAAILRKPLAKLGVSLFKKELLDISHRFNEVLEKFLVEYEEKLDKNHQDTEMLDELLGTCQDDKITRNHSKSLLVVKVSSI
ncbi:unnamed protein product [Thlaspi arvense]|uniref:Uncharacterized protein n=1 Tax=Thlaspi arvense TaxID=13288 RepID=A0AAU9R9R0_THLAR|nr:unnamed protein product [Thlaspi arvense]CAH2035107.1 unnamed protein product [Thlaspi arvense]